MSHCWACSTSGKKKIKEINEIRHRQEIIGQDQQEETVIMITPVDNPACTNCIQKGLTCFGEKQCSERPSGSVVKVDGKLYVRVSGKDEEYEKEGA